MKKLTILLARVAMVLLLVVLFPTGTWADPVTAESARQAAENFLKSHRTAGSSRKAPKTQVPELTLAGRVSGLYMFNIADDGGFVVVANDDRAVPILGFSNNGSVAPERMPDNMRAWLQGYADQIAWMNTHNVSVAGAPRQVGSHNTTDIDPLITSTWNQDEPFNNLCPAYSGNTRAATGCVATAMAQVMNYHRWPTSPTAAIPGYITDSYSLNLSTLPAVTFDRDNMLDSYSGSYTTEQGTAVATLMQYCGWSLEMDYGPESGATTDMVATALTNYFDYNSTAKFVSRSFYTAAKWADLIYYELANGRPVVYGGMSTGGGHEFVCDGYKYISGYDFFHINWGWGGLSDDYFVLSALDPDAQGIGGSTSTDGFCSGQDAVIGIQPSTGTGSIANITPNVIDLTVNSMTPSSNPAIIQTTMSVTLNITNNSVDDYEGDIYLGRKVGDDYSFLKGDNYFIASGETKDIVFSFAPQEAGTYDLVLFLPNEYGSYSTDCVVYATFEVINSQTNQYVPIYGYYCDDYSRSQFIIPSTDLADLVNATLNGVTFYASTTSAIIWPSAEFDVYLSEVNQTTISELKDWNTLEKVYSGSLSVGNDGKMVITFDTPYQYLGNNLLVGINQTVSAEDYVKSYWIGREVSGASLGGYGTSISQRNFIPLTTFDYTPGAAPAVTCPKDITINYTGGTTAEVSWTSSESAFDIDVNGTVTEDVTNPYTLTNLELATSYTVKVRAKNGSNLSEWSASATFNTDLSTENCLITFELIDNYGDGWNGAAIQVVDALTGIVISTVTNQNLNGSKGTNTYEVNTITVAVPSGRDINFVWVSGSYDDECSFSIYDVSGDLIYEFKESSSGPSAGVLTTYHVSCKYAPMPNDLAVAPTPISATVTWTDNNIASSYNLRYRAPSGFRYGFEAAAPWAVDDFSPCATYDGDGLVTYSFSGWNFTNQKYTGACIAFQNDNGDPSNLYAHSGNAFGLMFNPSNGSSADDWFILPEITIQDGDELSFWAREITDEYGSEVINVGIYGNTDGTFASTLAENLSIDTEVWTEHKFDLSAYAGQTIRLAINCVSKDIFGFMFDDIFVGNPNNDNSDWTTVTGVTSPYELDGLTAETLYEVQVQGVYPDGTSNWATASFTTPSLYSTPTNLASDLLDDGADISWTGYQNSYNVQYRTAGWRNVYAFDDFENGNTIAWTQNTGSLYAGIPYSGTNFLALGYETTGTHYLITPELNGYESGAYFEFYQRYYQSATTFKIGFSSTTADIDAFTWGSEQAATSSYTLFSQVIPDGTKYIALQTTSAAQANALFIDDCGIFGPATEPGEWQTVNNINGTTSSLTGLNEGIKYEWQVQGIGENNITTKWSESAYFTTYLFLADNADNSGIIAQFDMKQNVNVKLAGRTLFKDNNWNTLCLPFNVTIAGSELDGDGVEAKTLTEATMTGTTVGLTFGSAVTELQAGVPYIIKWDGDGSNNIINPTFKGVTIHSSTLADRTITKADEHVKFIGYYDLFNIDTPANDDIYYLTSDNTLKHTAKARTLKPCRAYFQFSEAVVNNVKDFVLDFDGESPTLVSLPSVSEEAGEWYDLSGRKVISHQSSGHQLPRGIYINNGRKIVIK